MSGDSVKVAVRVRPFNQREKKAGSKCIISMTNKETVISNPATGENRKFTFDFSYWSHNGYKENSGGVFTGTSAVYADQRKVYEDLGRGVLANAWQGYNAALFAYGQTGSGKSYSVVGYGPNKGIVPITCEELFKGIEKEKKNKDKQFQVTFSMLEIYNEHVRDLLTSTKQQPTGGLKVRQNPKIGFYVEDLKTLAVTSYKQIEQLMERGTLNRTTAATNMNETSSRSHMVITVTFKQVYKNECGQSTTKSSQINLVDLAGSERAASTGATGDRLREGSAINQSLSTLGKVISALADVACGKKKIVIPYRDSVLTKLLQPALGGNSRTIMIAALSPAAVNYEETLSTLRYADRAKRIQNKAVVNESPTDRLIRELKEENAKLMKELMSMQGHPGTPRDNIEDIRRVLAENEREMQNMQLSWEQRLQEAKQAWEQEQRGAALSLTDEQWRHLPHLQNVNEDAQLSGVVKTVIDTGKHIIGKPGNTGVGIELRGLGIQPTHATIEHKGNKVLIEPCNKKAKVLINGQKCRKKTVLNHLDRVILGSNHLYLYIGPPSARVSTDTALYDRYDYDYFQNELADVTGITDDLMRSMRPDDDADVPPETRLVFQQYTDLMPKIYEVNAMSEDMKKGVRFEAEIRNLASHDAMGRPKEKEVIVKVTNTKTKKVWIWSKEKFNNRRFMIGDIYQKWSDGEQSSVDRAWDPFWDPVEPVFLGSCHIWLNNLAHLLDSDDHLDIHDHHGKEEGCVHVKLIPCDKRGQKLKEEQIVFEPSDLLGKRLDFLVSISRCEKIKWIMEDESRGVYFGFNFFNQDKVTETSPVWNSVNPAFNFTKQLTLDKVTQETLQYLHSYALVLEMWGLQGDDSSDTDSLDSKSLDSSSDGLMTEVERLEALLKRKDAELAAVKKERDMLKSGVQINGIGESPSRGGSADSSSSRSTTCSRASSSTTDTVSMDAQIAKSLKVFFRDVKGVQNNLKELKGMGEEVDKASNNNNLKKVVKKQQDKLGEMDSDLNNCVSALKESLVTIIRHKKEKVAT